VVVVGVSGGVGFWWVGVVVFDVVGGWWPGVTLTGGMPRRGGVYIRIIVPVCFHSFCSRGSGLWIVVLCVHRFFHRLWITGGSSRLGVRFRRSFWSVFSSCWTCWENVINVY